MPAVFPVERRAVNRWCAPCRRVSPADPVDGAAPATSLRVLTGICVRDGTTAPVASLRPVQGRYESVETGGGALATVSTRDLEDRGRVDHHWSFEPVDRSPFD